MRTRARAALAIAAAVLGLACDGPEVVVGQAVEAARAGDRDAYAACFTPRSRAILRSLWTSAEDHNPRLAALGASDVRILGVQRVPRRGPGPAEAVVAIEEEGQRYRLVVQREGGTWRIDLLATELAVRGILFE